MKDIWVLSVKTSLPGTCYNEADLETTISAYESFEKAREALRIKVNDLAFTKNAMFDGNGKITAFDKYIKEFDGYDNDEDDEYETYKTVYTKIQNALYDIFSAEDTELKLQDSFYTDYMIGIKFDGESISFSGFDDGPCNGYDPILNTNMFSMKEEKDYYLYIDDRFGQDDECTAELYIDLKKVTLN